ncbi:hypothetical protein SJAG_06109 [Schizosaccharomyces japonicus yFS275]|uniref:Uncharacterized protein n=1 Tax=Schizosaccharomyces japonicus (strain yFS275 / FY16936) TaxID=402676 RepID=T0S317_SCHJY|nr:hypothetical protein SJAG_06109 [Schizosaccharomyces japonicus yFS275]EQC53006.1 hypothetical protein SJAG_06109 [Schizosaccharomyces japonicus yFS275]
MNERNMQHSLFPSIPQLPSSLYLPPANLEQNIKRINCNLIHVQPRKYPSIEEETHHWNEWKKKEKEKRTNELQRIAPGYSESTPLL